MIRSLWTSATGMQAQALNLDVIANNLANVNTSGFKKSRAEFQDLLYETLKPAGTSSSQDSQVPAGFRSVTVPVRRPCSRFSPRARWKIPATSSIWPLRVTAFFR